MDLLLVTKNKGQRKGAGGEEKVLKSQAEVKVMTAIVKKGRSARRRRQRRQKLMDEMELKFPKKKYKTTKGILQDLALSFVLVENL